MCDVDDPPPPAPRRGAPPFPALSGIWVLARRHRGSPIDVSSRAAGDAPRPPAGQGPTAAITVRRDGAAMPAAPRSPLPPPARVRSAMNPTPRLLPVPATPAHGRRPVLNGAPQPQAESRFRKPR
ncbi:hypothetical protein GCM10010123_16140 [Pilimelia anulata]|uniref:Uncharacterized protein n=1 Tax=Pilimelia anulata TaxID=53371 RepID=A0A8J3B1Y2_9ACTN|nr:hypothetical protein GCM10010123_16140 [Pilimelia anulata]